MPTSLSRQLSPSVSELNARSVLAEGQIARESTVAEGLVNKRYAVLYSPTKTDPPILASFRRQDDPEPSKCWALTRQSTLTEPVQQSMRLRVNTSTLMAVAGGLSTPVTMTCFSIHFNSGKLWGSDHLTLCFENGEMASAWHRKIGAAIKGLKTRRSLHIELPAVPSSEELLPDDSSSSLGRESPTRQYLDGLTGDIAGTDYEARPRSRWHSVHHINGVTVYAEDDMPDGEGGAYMVSAVVRAPPEETFKCLMQLPFCRDTRLLFGNASILEVIDAHTQVVHHKDWRPTGILGRLSAPREMVLLRTWRQDEDGTYIVLYQSTRHGRARETNGGLLSSWTQPVRAKVEAAGYTVSPLLPKYTVKGESSECLVTVVMKVDLGGWLPSGGLLCRALDGAQWAWLDPLILSVVALRDKVEQSRFVMAPSMGASAPMETPRMEREEAVTNTTSYRIPPMAHAIASATLEPLEAIAAAAGEDGLTPSAAAEPEPSFPQPSPEEEWAVNGTCHHCWTCPGASNLKIRGKKYLQDKKKIPAALPMFDLYASDLLDVDEPLWHVARYLPSVKYCREPFMFIMQLMIPCNPPQSLVIIWTAPVNPMTADMDTLLEYWPEDENGTVRSFFTNFKDWLEGDGKEADKRRNTKFKLIPQVQKGSWIVRQSVGTTPVLLGQKLLTRYFRGPNYFEVDVDITANTVAASITSMVVGAITTLVVDLAVLIEGQNEAELPERLAGSVRFSHLRLKNAAYLDEESGKIYRQSPCC